MRESIRIFTARRIHTMNASSPEATAVAVRDGRIVGVGAIDELRGWGEAEVDDRFRDKFLLPGLVEGHSHFMEGGMWKYPYAGFYDRRGPDGTVWPGLRSIDAVVERLRAFAGQMADPDATLFAWGFDPIFLTGPRMSAADLERVSRTRPVVVLHANAHLLNVNTVALRRAGITRATDIDGIVRDERGEPSGEIAEFAAMFMVFRKVGRAFFGDGYTDEGLWNFGRVAQLGGVTTAVDLSNDLAPGTIDAMQRATQEACFPLRLVPALFAVGVDPGNGIAQITEARRGNTDKLRFGPVKLMTDGSIQGFTARLKWPGYFDGSPNGMWNLAPEQLDETLAAYHAAGLQVHIHTNGDEASEVTLDAVERALARHPRWDHRHTLQHCQLADAAQFRRMRALGVAVNLFSNHLYYWGDVHHARTVGPERARRMNACATAQREGVRFAIHSDAPVTPIGPLFTAWCAVNRLTASGRVLGEHERIGVAAALEAITLGAAYTLRLDHEIGSIECGKRADFCVLDEDPLAAPPEMLKDIPVWGTVLGGQVFPTASAA